MPEAVTMPEAVPAPPPTPEEVAPSPPAMGAMPLPSLPASMPRSQLADAAGSECRPIIVASSPTRSQVAEATGSERRHFMGGSSPSAASLPRPAARPTRSQLAEAAGSERRPIIVASSPTAAHHAEALAFYANGQWRQRPAAEEPEYQEARVDGWLVRTYRDPKSAYSPPDYAYERPTGQRVGNAPALSSEEHFRGRLERLRSTGATSRLQQGEFSMRAASGGA
jgi:hypothetical protein